MYEPYEERRETKLKRFFNNLRDRFEAFKQDLRFQESHSWVIVFIPITLMLLAGLTYTGYVTYTGRVTEAQSKIMILERQMSGIEDELEKANTELDKCRSDLSKTESDLSSTKASLQDTQNNLELCALEKEDLTTELNEKEKNLGDWIAKYNSLESDYNNLECNFAKFKCNLYYTIKNNDIECCIKTEDNKFYCGIGIETSAENVKMC